MCVLAKPLVESRDVELFATFSNRFNLHLTRINYLPKVF